MDRYADLLNYLPIGLAALSATGRIGNRIGSAGLAGLGVYQGMRRNQMLEEQQAQQQREREQWQQSLGPGGALVTPRPTGAQLPQIETDPLDVPMGTRPEVAPIVNERMAALYKSLPMNAGIALLAKQEQERAPKVIVNPQLGGFRIPETGPAEQIIKPLAQQPVVPKTGDSVFVQAAQQKFPDSPESQANYIRELRNNPAGWQNQVFNDLVEANGGDKAAAAQQLINMQVGRAEQTSAAGERGRLGVKATPQYQQTERNIARERAEGRTEGTPLEATTQRDIAGLEGALRQVGNIRNNLDDQFLGPIRGTDVAFSTRRSIGNYINAPLGNKETVFRQSIADVADQLLRARSGAQINEQEYKRLRGMLPKATDEPQVFRAGLQRFENELNNTIQSKRTLGITPRGGGGSSETAPRGIPKVLSIEKIAD